MNIDTVPTDYQPAPNLLADHIILVTGAGDGIGKAAAIAFAHYGAIVILAGRTVAKLEAVYDQIEQAGYPLPTIYPVDLEGATEADYQQLCEVIDEQFGRLDGLLHNAGVLGQRTPLANYKPSVWNTVLQINLTAPFMMTQALLPVLEKSSAASVVFISSGVGRTARAFWGAYSVSKFGIEALSKIWAEELEEVTNIRVNALNPGRTRTMMRALAYPGEDPHTLKKPEEIMAAYLYLMGPDSRGISGKTYNAQ